ncbi:MAG: LysR family transcriptional regulator [Acidimicrobiales bacterium]
MRLDIDSLRAFRAIVESGSFTGAASRLYLTQSAVSWKIKRLEERMGHTLLVRKGKGIELTPMGEELLVHADRILSAHDEAVASLELSELTGTVRLGCNDEPDLAGIAAVIRNFRVRHPRVKVHTRIALSSTVNAWLRAGELDLAIVQVIADELDDSDVVLRTDQLAWFADADLVLPEDGAVPLITFGPKCFYRPIAEKRLREAGLEYSISLECESSAGVIAAVDAGLGVTVLNAHHPAAPPEIRRWQDVVLPADLPEVCLVARRSSRSRDSAVRSLQAELVDGFHDETIRLIGNSSL